MAVMTMNAPVLRPFVAFQRAAGDSCRRGAAIDPGGADGCQSNTNHRRLFNQK